MERKEYHGWTNYETWLAKLWMDNDGRGETYDERAREIAQEIIYADTYDAQGIRQAIVSRLADEMKEEHYDAMPEQTGVYADLINAASQEINWYEIAEHFAADVTLWSAGRNMPGYMPDSAPAIFVGHDDALGHVGYALDEEEESEDLDSARDDLDNCQGEYGVTVGKYHYWITKV